MDPGLVPDGSADFDRLVRLSGQQPRESGLHDARQDAEFAFNGWVREWLKIPAVQQALGKSPEQLEKWRCKSAKALDWIDWAKAHGVRRLSDSPAEVALPRFGGHAPGECVSWEARL